MCDVPTPLPADASAHAALSMMKMMHDRNSDRQPIKTENRFNIQAKKKTPTARASSSASGDGGHAVQYSRKMLTCTRLWALRLGSGFHASETTPFAFRLPPLATPSLLCLSNNYVQCYLWTCNRSGHPHRAWYIFWYTICTLLCVSFRKVVLVVVPPENGPKSTAMCTCDLPRTTA